MNKLQFIDGKLEGFGFLVASSIGDVQQEIINVEVDEELYNKAKETPDLYILVNGEVIQDPDYEEKQAQKERERIGNLQVTKRVFALGLQQMGISYNQLKELIATNEQAQLEWELCVELERKNPLIDIMGAQLGVTPEQIDYIFRKANGEEVEPNTGENSNVE